MPRATQSRTTIIKHTSVRGHTVSTVRITNRGMVERYETMVLPADPDTDRHLSMTEAGAIIVHKSLVKSLEKQAQLNLTD